MTSIHESLASLQTNFADLILIHWPGVKGLKLDDSTNLVKRLNTWKALEFALSEGLTKHIGVANYNVRQLTELLTYAKVKPQWLQVRLLLVDVSILSAFC